MQERGWRPRLRSERSIFEVSNWYKYVISFEGNTNLQGYRQGSLAAVTESVEEFVAQLNERHMGKRGRVNLAPTPKKKIGK